MDAPSPRTRSPGGSRYVWNRCEREQKTCLKAGSEQLPPDAPPVHAVPVPSPAPQKTPEEELPCPRDPEHRYSRQCPHGEGHSQPTPLNETQPAPAQLLRLQQRELTLREGWEPGPGPDSSRNCEKSRVSSESRPPMARYGSPRQQDRCLPRSGRPTQTL